jgi:hypothetical protein
MCFASVSGLWLLDTATAGGSLLADSRLAVSTSLPGGFGFDNQATLTPDGTKIIVPWTARVTDHRRGVSSLYRSR